MNNQTKAGHRYALISELWWPCLTRAWKACRGKMRENPPLRNITYYMRRMRPLLRSICTTNGGRAGIRPECEIRIRVRGIKCNGTGGKYRYEMAGI